MDDKTYEDPKSCFQQKVNEIIEAGEASNIVKDLVKLQLLKSSEKNNKYDSLIEIYKLIGFEKFCDLIDLLDGKTVKFFTKASLRDNITTALCYYFRNVEGKSWPEIRDILGDEKLKSAKHSIRVSQLQEYIEYVASGEAREDIDG